MMNNDNISITVDTNDYYKSYFRIRTITCFITLTPDDFVFTIGKNDTTTYTQQLENKIQSVSTFLNHAEYTFVSIGKYTVQTKRIATNPFTEWMLSSCDNNDTTTSPATGIWYQQLQQLDSVLEKYNIEFCSLGPATTINEINSRIIPIIISSGRFSCSANLDANDIDQANAIANIIVQISELGNTNNTVINNNKYSINKNNQNHIIDGIGNFRFCCTSTNTKSNIPFFPAAKGESSSITKSAASTSTSSSSSSCTSNSIISFAIGFENGALLHTILNNKCYNKFNKQFTTILRNELLIAYTPIHQLCLQLETTYTTTSTSTESIQYIGIDTSFNPSLDVTNGSVAAAIEGMDIISKNYDNKYNSSNGVFGSSGTLAVAAAITQCIQSLSPVIRLCGYCGLMLPLCEDHRLAELVNNYKHSTDTGTSRSKELRISDLLSISQICGVGVDTVPIPGIITIESNDTDTNTYCTRNKTNNNIDELVIGIQSLLLDVSGIAHRWDKSLSCRVFPVPNKKAGEITTFNSPYLVNTKILPL